MTTALALIEDGQYNLMAKLARIAAQSGYSKQNETQAMFIMLKGFELGISPMQALDGIQVIQGKTTVSPQLMLALINRSGQLEDMTIDSTAVRCVVTMKRLGRSPHTETFTMDNAKAMQLAGKDNWNKQPAVMLKWRAVSACARIVFPDVIQGMYTPEEMGAEVSEDASGEIIIEQAPLAVLPPPNVEVSTGEIVEGVITETPPETDLKPPSSDLDASDHPDIATNGKTPAERLGTPSGQRIGTEPPKEGDCQDFQVTSVKVVFKDGQPRYALNATNNAVIWAYSRDVFRGMGYPESVIEDWGTKEQTIKFEQKMPLQAEWKLYKTGKEPRGGYWAALVKDADLAIISDEPF